MSSPSAYYLLKGITRIFLMILLWSGPIAVVAQHVLSENEVVTLALNHSPLLKAADLQVSQRKALQKTAFNLPNPEIMAESPTGTFYAVGVLQSLEFPTVYWKQAQLLKQQSALAAEGKKLTTAEITRLIRSLYLNVQYEQLLLNQFRYQDSLYHQIHLAAKRQFDAGVIDHLEKTFAELQYGEIHNQYMQGVNSLNASTQQLSLYTGVTEEIRVTQLSKTQPISMNADTTALLQSPFLQYSRQNQRVTQQQLSLARHRVMPGLVFGYLNQGEKETETYYRFRVGFTVPLWFWQYGGDIKAAKAGVHFAEQELLVQQQQLTADLQTALSQYTSAQQALTYYETQGLHQADDLIDTARRFFESGDTDFVTYIRTINDAYAIKKKFLDSLRDYNQSIINIHYITGDL